MVDESCGWSRRNFRLGPRDGAAMSVGYTQVKIKKEWFIKLPMLRSCQLGSNVCGFGFTVRLGVGAG